MIKTVWWRKIPHPEYEYYGGAKRRCKSKTSCLIPSDRLDGHYKDHDDSGNDDWGLVKRLSKDMVNGHFLTGRYARPIYGRFHHIGALVVFSISSGIQLFFKGDRNGK